MWNIVESGVSTWLSSLGVVDLTTVVVKFRVPFQETDKEDDLDLGGERKGIPLLGRRKVGSLRSREKMQFSRRHSMQNSDFNRQI